MRPSRRSLGRLSGLFLIALAVGPVSAQTTDPGLPRGEGLAARYPGDAGLADDPAVLLFEDFEIERIDDLERRWESVSNEGNAVLALDEDVPAASLGRQSLRMTASPPANSGGHLYTRLPRGVDRVFARFYVKFPEDAGYVHHFVHLGGYNPPTPYPQGGAGSRPEGHERMTVGIEPFGLNGRTPPPGLWNFYAYWPEMKISADGRYWGNSIKPTLPPAVPRGRWQCVEVMMSCNSSRDTRDGELALWLDGALAMHIAPGTPRGPWTGLGFDVLDEGGEPFEGFRWRTDDDLQINFFWILHYVTDTNNRRNRVDTRRTSPVLFDHVVVASEYVGPIAERAEP